MQTVGFGHLNGQSVFPDPNLPWGHGRGYLISSFSDLPGSVYPLGLQILLCPMSRPLPRHLLRCGPSDHLPRGCGAACLFLIPQVCQPGVLSLSLSSGGLGSLPSCPILLPAVPTSFPILSLLSPPPSPGSCSSSPQAAFPLLWGLSRLAPPEPEPLQCFQPTVPLPLKLPRCLSSRPCARRTEGTRGPRSPACPLLGLPGPQLPHL
jgi:hypothetical protein